MILVFALLVYIDGEIQQDRTSYWLDIQRCIYHAQKINDNESIRSGSLITAICLPEWVDKNKAKVLK